MATYSMLTTIDNPYDPSTDFDNWFKFDSLKGYNTCGYIARIANTAESLPENINSDEIERAINWIAKNDPFKIYIKRTYEDG